MNFEVLYSCALCVQLAAFLWKLRDLLRDPRDPRLAAITLALLFVAAGFNCALPAVYRALGAVSGIPNLATLLVYSSIVLCTAALQVFAVNLARSRAEAVPAGRVLVLGTVAALVAMGVLFRFAPVHGEPHVLDFDSHYCGSAAVLGFLAVYLAAYSAGLVRCALVCLRIRPHAGDPWLRRGVSLVPVGVLFGLGYAVLKVVAVVGIRAGAGWEQVSDMAAPVSATIGACVMAAGFVLPSVPRLQRRVRARRCLRPLLRALRPLAPELARNKRLTSVEYRRLVATEDLLRALRPYLSAEVAATAERLADRRGLTGAERAAAVEAARIAAALRARESGAAPGDGRAMIREESGVDAPPAEVRLRRFPDQDPGGDFAAELHRMCLIGEAFRRPHPLVREVLAG